MEYGAGAAGPVGPGRRPNRIKNRECKKVPLPPYHLAPGTALKLLGGRSFSFTVFTFSQVLMDVEPLIRILRDDVILHGFTNTALGAAVVGLLSVWPGRPICENCLRIWNASLNPGQNRWLGMPSRIGLRAAIYASASGVSLHFILDAMMHGDARPWAPLSESNPFLGVVPLDWLHLGLAGIGVLSVVSLVSMWCWRRWTCEVE